MHSIAVKMPAIKPRNYKILIKSQLLSSVKSWLPSHLQFKVIVIITDTKIKKLYGLSLEKQLQQQGYDVLIVTTPMSEAAKSYTVYQKVIETMLRYPCARDTLCLALGGGSVGDLAGFVAATYLRGIPYLQIPTSLLAMIDSSVGGKTAINSMQGKNLIGAFHQPSAVVLDTALLKSLSRNQLCNGIYEALKMFLTHNSRDFNYLKTNIQAIFDNDEATLQSIIRRALKIKANIVSADEKESGERITLNFGHTIGHALETLNNYRIAHGFAVALGILVEAKIAELLGLLDSKDFLVIKTFLSQFGVKGVSLKKYSIPKIIAATYHDKKVNLGKVHYILLNSIGNVHYANNHWAHPVTDNIVKQALCLVSEP